MSYRRLLGLLLLWAVVPLPFLYVVLPPFWIIALVAAVLAVSRPERSFSSSQLTENLVAIAMVVVVVLTGGLRVGPVRPLGHLLLLLTAWRSFSVVDRTSALKALPPVFLLWLAAVASSTHLALAPYLVASVAVWWWAGMSLLLMGLEPERRWRPAELPRLRHAVVAALLVTLLAVPVFVAMPRLNSPWVAGATVRRSSGFSTNVELARSGAIQESRELALSLQTSDGELVDPLWTRLRGTAFNMVFAGRWTRSGNLTRPPQRRLGLVWLDPRREDLDGTQQLELELMQPREYLFVPEGAVALRAPVPVELDGVGGVVITGEHSGPLRYTVWATRQPSMRRDLPLPRDIYLPNDNQVVKELSRQVVDEATTAAERAELIEGHLQSSYAYSLEVSGVERSDPVAWFLTEGRQGHCEFFAGAMVVMLRHVGVPARLVGGYSGGALDPSGTAATIRQANAHTWVEAWLGEERGWQLYDPTPAEGVPELVARSGLERLQWLWERVTDSWDRYVLTFGLGEQVGLLVAAGQVLRWLAGLWSGPRLLLVLAVLLALWGAVRSLPTLRPALGLGRRRRPPAAIEVERLSRRLRRAGVMVPVQATVRWIAAAAGRQWPAAEPAAVRLAEVAEQELYGSARDYTGSARELRLLRRRLDAAVRRSRDERGVKR